MILQYRHAVKDRIGGWIVYESRKGTYKNTHDRAEKYAKSLGKGDRYEIIQTEPKEQK